MAVAVTVRVQTRSSRWCPIAVGQTDLLVLFCLIVVLPLADRDGGKL